jgi:hypothetical protein
VVLCVVAAALWFGLLIFEPRTRTLSFGFAVSSFLAIGLFKAFRGGATRLRPWAMARGLTRRTPSATLIS